MLKEAKIPLDENARRAPSDILWASIEPCYYMNGYINKRRNVAIPEIISPSFPRKEYPRYHFFPFGWSLGSYGSRLHNTVQLTNEWAKIPTDHSRRFGSVRFKHCRDLMDIARGKTRGISIGREVRLDSSRRELPDGWTSDRTHTHLVLSVFFSTAGRVVSAGEIWRTDISLRMHHELITNIRRLSCIDSLAQLTLSYRFDIPF